jgi:uncharacterized membrane protein YgcG
MTTAADDSAVEDAFEALLVGRPVPEGAAGLAAFTEAVRTSATRPGRPNAALAELLASGLLADQSSPSVRTATSAGSVPERRRSRVRTRRRPAMIFSALIAKFLSAGAVAQAATGATVAVVAFTGVGAVGALPDPVQDTFATVVAEITPLEPPTSEETTLVAVPEEAVPEETVAEAVDTTEEATEVPTDAEALEAEVKAWALDGPAEGESIGDWVSKGSTADVKGWLRAHGMTFGNVVSAHASGKGFSKEELAVLGAELDEPTDGETEPETVVDTDVTETEQAETGVSVTENRGSRGNGSGNGKATSGNGKATSGGGKATSGNGGGNGNAGGNGKN